jgi:predicted amidophosphoribosyltransferase
VPTTPGRVRERGFDQSKTAAKSLARAKKLHFSPTLRRLTKSHQVGAGKKERREHMAGAFVVKNPHLLRDKTVVLVDDVITTGSTVESAAKELKKAGAKKILAVVFARAE